MIHNQQTTCVFPSPSKIPYGGFSPVRLQTEILPPPSPCAQELSAARIPPATAYKRPKFRHLQITRPTEGLTVVDRMHPAQAALRSSAQDDSVQRPLARQRVVLSRHVIAYYGLIRASRSPPPDLCLRGWLVQPRGLPWAENERFPNLLLVSLPSCRPPYPGGPDGCLWLCFPIRSGLRHFVVARHPHAHTRRFWRGSCNEAAKFALCYGPKACSPFTDKDFYAQAFTGVDRSTPMSSITTRANSQFPRPDLHRQETRHYGLQTKGTKE